MTPKEVFRTKDLSVFAQDRADNGLTKIVEEQKDENGKLVLDENGKPKPKIIFDEEKGWLTYYVSFDYPEKGIRDNFMMISVQIVKRNLMEWVNFFTYKWLLPAYIPFLFLPKIKILERFMHSIESFSGIINEYAYPFIMEKKYYTPFGRELIKGLEIFFKELGVSDQRSNEFAIILVSLIDPDLAYRYRTQDVLSETTAEKLIAKPITEIKLLLNAWVEREGSEQVKDKIKRLSWLRWCLLHPKIRKAFRKAIGSVKFENLQLDEGDQYHVKFLHGYKFFGLTFEERCEKWPEVLGKQYVCATYKP